jgi:TrmH family RNA methyltransferase
MSERPTIRSASNPVVRRVRSALAGRERDGIVLEGDRLLEDALAAGFEVELAVVAERRRARGDELAARGIEVCVLENGLFERASSLVTSQGVLAIGRAPRERTLETTPLGSEALLLAVAGVADPGNLGGLARSAEAAGAEALVHVAGGASPWSPKALRGSMGSLLRLPVLRFDAAPAAIAELALHGFRHVRAATRGGPRPSEFDWTGRIALWVGSETGELPPGTEAFERVTIPMKGSVESLNVTVAASLLLFSAGRA